MSEEPQVVFISSTPALNPDEIEHKNFPQVRRGLDGDAVRAFLAKAATELREALQREGELRDRVADAEHRAAHPDLDEATLTRAIGTETAKILAAAHEAARNVAANAEKRAAELTAEAEHVLEDRTTAAETQVSTMRGAAEREVADALSKAHAEAVSVLEAAQDDAVELLDATKAECRRMVAEARELRARTLADLGERRRSLRVQLEELRTGKDSLIEVVDAVAVSVGELRSRLANAEDEARVAAEEAGLRVEREPSVGDLR
jgi:DivIVA domain-containing protein